jgi:hypothetical protein
MAQQAAGAGSAVDVLIQAGSQASVFHTTAQVRAGKNDIQLNVVMSPQGIWVSDNKGTNVSYYQAQGATTREGAWRTVVDKWSHGTLLIESITSRSTKPPLSPKQMKDLAIKAWCELFNVPVPSAEELKAAAKAKKQGTQKKYDEWSQKLREEGPAAWNALMTKHKLPFRQWPNLDLAKAELPALNFTSMDCKGADFSRADLSGATLCGCKLQDAKFTKAKLAKANLFGANLSRCNLENADLTAANLNRCTLKEAILHKAKLNKANLEFADLCGADFSNAQWKDVSLANAAFDEATKFPEGFKPAPPMKWVGQGPSPIVAALLETRAKEPINIEEFLKRLEDHSDPAKLDKALRMLKAERFKLYAEVADDHLVGIVKSQSDPTLVYSCKLANDGVYGCCTQNLNICGGLRGSLCKHLLVLIVGLAKNGELDANQIDTWVLASRGQKPAIDKDAMSATFLRYKGAEAGEVDWRPTETIPEDYYAY